AGAFIARWGMTVLVRIGAARIPRAHEIALDWTVFGFLLAVCVGAAVLFGLAPAIVATRSDGRGADPGWRRADRASVRRIRDGLIVVEIALAFVLALGGALVMREVQRLQHVNPGMTTDGVTALHLTPIAPAATYEAIE